MEIVNIHEDCRSKCIGHYPPLHTGRRVWTTRQRLRFPPQWPMALYVSGVVRKHEQNSRRGRQYSLGEDKGSRSGERKLCGERTSQSVLQPSHASFSILVKERYPLDCWAFPAVLLQTSATSSPRFHSTAKLFCIRVSGGHVCFVYGRPCCCSLTRRRFASACRSMPPKKLDCALSFGARERDDRAGVDHGEKLLVCANPKPH